MSVWVPGDAGAASDKLHAPATLRNRDAILAVLRDALPSSGLVLEVASGSGEHAAYFAAALSHLNWQPSDPEASALASIDAWRVEAKLPNLLPPVMLDAAAPWPVNRADAIICINMAHISPWSATLGLMEGAGKTLPAGGLLYLYGPFIRDEVETAPSNLAFDASLKARDPQWGLRRIEEVSAAAEARGFSLDRLIEMPANNLSLLFRKVAPDGL